MKVKFLTVIWGARYIDEFARISLPSYLSPGNLPWVASRNELEIVVLTSSEGRVHFEQHPIMEKLTALCPVRYIMIDDLIAGGAYGVTLTAAYARGILDSGGEQTNTCFVFMNSDFVLADGSLRTLVTKIAEGYPCVKTPSLRAIAESALPPLLQELSADGFSLTLQPRDLVRIVFDNLHLTVVAKTVTQEFLSCKSYTQIYWQVDDRTLIARHHLIFMMAVKPEVPLAPLNSYSDYGFMPELVPSRKFALLGDSDEFFVAELQSSNSERNLVKGGTPTVEEIASELSKWTTPEHRAFADVDIIFHSGDLNPELDRARVQVARFMDELKSKMSREPIDHVDHPYWLSGVQYWASLKFADQRIILPPELRDRNRAVLSASGMRSRVIRLYGDFIGWMRRRTHSIPDTPIWHYQWLDSRLLLDWIAQVKSRSDARVLLICSTADALAASLPKHLPVDVCSDVALLDTDKDKYPAGSSARGVTEAKYDNILMHVFREGISGVPDKLRAAERHLAPGGVLSIFVEHCDAELEGGDMSRELSQFAEYLLPQGWINYHCSARFAGGNVRFILRATERGLYRHLWPLSLRRLPLIVCAAAAWGALAGLTALNNIRGRRDSARFPHHCSSILLSLSRRSET